MRKYLIVSILLLCETSFVYAQSAEEYFRQGLQEFTNGSGVEAIVDYTKAIEIDPEYEPVYFRRAQAYCETGEYEKAIADFTKALNLKPNEARTYSSLGRCYYEMGRYGDAINELNKALDLVSHNLAAYQYQLRGRCYFRSNNWEQAIEDYTQSLSIQPSLDIHLDTFLDRAVAYEKWGDVEKSKSDLKQAISGFSKHINSMPSLAKWEFYCRGFAYFMLKEYDKAWEDYRQSQSLGYMPKKDDFQYLDELKKATGQ